MNRPDWRTVPCDDYPKAWANGYGAQNKHGENGAHRVAWTEAFGPIPPGKWVLHHCDRRICREPLHLFLGDNASNVADRQAKGRQARGERFGTSRISDADALKIRERAAAGHPMASMAREYGVSKAAISKLVKGKNRKWMGGPVLSGDLRKTKRTLATRRAA